VTTAQVTKGLILMLWLMLGLGVQAREVRIAAF